MGESGGVLDGGVGVNLPPLGAHAMLKPNYMDRVSLSKPEKTCQKERDHQVQPSNVIFDDFSCPRKLDISSLPWVLVN